MEVESYSICLFMTGLSHLALCPQVVFILSHMAGFPYFSRPNNIPLYAFRNWNPCGWECKMVQLLWKIVWRFFKKLKRELHMIQQVHFWVFVPKNGNQDLKDISVLLSVHYSIIYNSQDVENNPSVHWWMNGKKLWYIYTMEYYSAIKRNEIELFVRRWMDLVEPVIRAK